MDHTECFEGACVRVGGRGVVGGEGVLYYFRIFIRLCEQVQYNS